MTRITDRLSVEGPDAQGYFKLQFGRWGDWTTISPAEASVLIRAVQGPAERPRLTRADIARAVKDVRAADQLDDAVDLALRHLVAAPPSASAGERKVGCEGGDGLLRVHAEAESCEVCAPVAAPSGDGSLRRALEDALDGIEQKPYEEWVADVRVALLGAIAALSAPAAVTPTSATEWWGVIGPRGMPCLYGKHFEDAEPDSDERVALFRVTELDACPNCHKPTVRATLPTRYGNRRCTSCRARWLPSPTVPIVAQSRVEEVAPIETSGECSEPPSPYAAAIVAALEHLRAYNSDRKAHSYRPHASVSAAEHVLTASLLPAQGQATTPPKDD